MSKSFIYNNQLSDLGFYENEALPCIFLGEDNNYSLIINSNELNSCQSLEYLIELIKEKLGNN
ncbi:hypothetical protein OA856_00900 [Pelagibacteraceae bacterium]|nr:hypothetical protein [Pelagibacteraceae bacterium]